MLIMIQQADLPKLVKNRAAFGSTKPGVMIIGPAGTGKTTIVREIYAYDWGNRTGHKMIQQQVTQRTYPHLDIDSLSRYPLFIDELGASGMVINNTYGNLTNPTVEVLTIRYDVFKKPDDKVWGPDSKANYFTSNCTPEEIEQLFGDHIWSRIQEMCDVFVVDESTAIDYRTGKPIVKP
jgi:hypothetical protein